MGLTRYKISDRESCKALVADNGQMANTQGKDETRAGERADDLNLGKMRSGAATGMHAAPAASERLGTLTFA